MVSFPRPKMLTVIGSPGLARSVLLASRITPVL
jgi:hypothetical protein